MGGGIVLAVVILAIIHHPSVRKDEETILRDKMFRCFHSFFDGWQRKRIPLQKLRKKFKKYDDHTFNQVLKSLFVNHGYRSFKRGEEIVIYPGR